MKASNKTVLKRFMLQVSPKGIEFAKYSIDYHYIRNYIHVNRHWSSQRAAQHIPEFAKRIVAEYDQEGEVQKRLAMHR
jgi:7-hydroxymethyl chlorophyll a reductase